MTSKERLLDSIRVIDYRIVFVVEFMEECKNFPLLLALTSIGLTRNVMNVFYDREGHKAYVIFEKDNFSKPHPLNNTALFLLIKTQFSFLHGVKKCHFLGWKKNEEIKKEYGDFLSFQELLDKVEEIIIEEELQEVKQKLEKDKNAKFDPKILLNKNQKWYLRGQFF